MSTEGWDPFFAKNHSLPHLTEEREAGLADPERYDEWAREHGVMCEDAEEWLVSPAAGVLARRTRPPGTVIIIPPPRTSTGGYGAYGHAG